MDLPREKLNHLFFSLWDCLYICHWIIPVEKQHVPCLSEALSPTCDAAGVNHNAMEWPSEGPQCSGFTSWRQLRTLGSTLPSPKAEASSSCCGIWREALRSRASPRWSHDSPGGTTWQKRSGGRGQRRVRGGGVIRLTAGVCDNNFYSHGRNSNGEIMPNTNTKI